MSFCAAAANLGIPASSPAVYIDTSAGAHVSAFAPSLAWVGLWKPRYEPIFLATEPTALPTEPNIDRMPLISPLMRLIPQLTACDGQPDTKLTIFDHKLCSAFDIPFHAAWNTPVTFAHKDVASETTTCHRPCR